MLSEEKQREIVKKIIDNAGDGKTFPELEDGNCGTQAYLISEAKATVVLGLANPEYISYDRDKELILALLVTWDEPCLLIYRINKVTLEAKFVGEVSFFNSLALDENGEEPDPFHAYYLLLKDAVHLDLPSDKPGWTIAAFCGE